MRVKSDDPPNIDELALLLFFFSLVGEVQVRL